MGFSQCFQKNKNNFKQSDDKLGIPVTEMLKPVKFSRYFIIYSTFFIQDI